ncbi:VanZ family protein [Calycomorphotria hydatis]|uniref:VanZ like family protein n=1 Tax=Calycomorphotria hydatis TaxID=2528027 RepID=A0A517T551_9PLAN|nr:VanZ family protein [Calycomorphotria hydatis]QDT63505.1 VanZ like family protein [Calycomorphotria hydatis]
MRVVFGQSVFHLSPKALSRLHFRSLSSFVAYLLLSLGAIFQVSRCEAAQIVVKPGEDLRAAAELLEAGDELLLMPGKYRGGIIIQRSQGATNRPIVIRSLHADEPAVIEGGGDGMKLSSVSHFELHDLIIEGASSNGLNIDDAGYKGKQVASHHITLRNVAVRNIGGGGNSDGIKMSGAEQFLIENCQISNWGAGGQAIDLVGCSDGKITRCEVDGAERCRLGLQTKGGSTRITIEDCFVRNVRDRGIQLGGRTGKSFFRPEVGPFEATEISVIGSQVNGGEAAFSFVGVKDCRVAECVLVKQSLWPFRVLQENVGPPFEPCQSNTFERNVIVWNAAKPARAVNIGPNTKPDTFVMRENVWFCQEAQQHSTPLNLPVPDTESLYGVDPKLKETEDGRLTPSVGFEELKKRAEQQRKEKLIRQGQVLGFSAVVLAVLFVVPWFAEGQTNLRWQRIIPQVYPAAASARFDRPLDPRNVWWFLLAGALLLIVAASITPFIWKGPTLTEGMREFWLYLVYRTEGPKADALMNLVAFVPVGFAAMGLAPSRGFWRRGWPVVVILSALMFGLLMEFLQIWIPERYPGRNDLIAQSAGTAGGMILWGGIGPTLRQWIPQVFAEVRRPQIHDIAAAIFSAAVLIGFLWPFDFISDLSMLNNKLKSGGVRLVPLADGIPNWEAAIGGMLPCVVLGYTIATGLTSSRTPVRPLRVSLFASCVLLLVVEGVQVILAERVSDANDVVIGVAGCVCGAWGANLMQRSTYFSPYVSIDRYSECLRWAATGVLALTVLLLTRTFTA